MPIAEKLQASWDLRKRTEAVGNVKAALDNLKQTGIDTEAVIDAAMDGVEFDDVDAEIRSEGAACIAIVEALNEALANHADFIDWKPERKP